MVTGAQSPPSGRRAKKPTAGIAPAVGQTKTLPCGPAALRYFMPTHLLFSIGFNAPKAFGSPQYLAPVAQVMR